MANQTIIKIVGGPALAAEVTSALSNPSHGGRAFFFGAVRNFNHGRPVRAVSYECHQRLAVSILGEIISELRKKWGSDLDVVVIHGTDRIGVGELSVGLGVSSSHREEAFEACRYLIEQLKLRVPIWKQEHYIDGDSEWLKGHALCQHKNPNENHSHLNPLGE